MQKRSFIFQKPNLARYAVAGWDEGVLGMQLGEVAKIRVC